MLIPIVLVGMLIAVQPAIVLYDRIVMEAAAAEGCRVLETLPESDMATVRDYVLRRLDAVPAIPAFHVGSWSVEVTGAGQQSQRVSVRISHAYEPLPLMGAGMQLVGLAQGDGLARQEVFRETRPHDEWALGSEFGLNFGDWVQRWEDKA